MNLVVIPEETIDDDPARSSMTVHRTGVPPIPRNAQE